MKIERLLRERSWEAKKGDFGVEAMKMLSRCLTAFEIEFDGGQRGSRTPTVGQEKASGPRFQGTKREKVVSKSSEPESLRNDGASASLTLLVASELGGPFDRASMNRSEMLL